MQAQARLRTPQIALIVLTVITALIHFERALQDPDIRILFITVEVGLVLGVRAATTPIGQAMS